MTIEGFFGGLLLLGFVIVLIKAALEKKEGPEY